MRIDCAQLGDLLFDFVSGDLSAERRALLEEHLQACPPCLVHIETYRVTIRLTRQLPKMAMPPEMAQRLRTVLERECGKQSG